MEVGAKIDIAELDIMYTYIHGGRNELNGILLELGLWKIRNIRKQEYCRMKENRKLLESGITLPTDLGQRQCALCCRHC